MSAVLTPKNNDAPPDAPIQPDRESHSYQLITLEWLTKNGWQKVQVPVQESTKLLVLDPVAQTIQMQHCVEDMTYGYAAAAYTTVDEITAAKLSAPLAAGVRAKYSSSFVDDGLTFISIDRSGYTRRACFESSHLLKTWLDANLSLRNPFAMIAPRHLERLRRTLGGLEKVEVKYVDAKIAFHARDELMQSFDRKSRKIVPVICAALSSRMLQEVQRMNGSCNPYRAVKQCVSGRTLSF